MPLPKEVRDDNRPRHVRLCEQEFRRKSGGTLRIDHGSGRARLYSHRDEVVMKMPTTLADEAHEALRDEYPEHFIFVRDGLYAGDVPADEPDDAEPDDGGQDVEKLTVAEIRERWPALDEHYKSLSSGLGVAARNGHITKSKDGRLNRYHIDEDFHAWIDSLPLEDYGIESPDEEMPAASSEISEQPADDSSEAEDEQQAEEPETGPETGAETEPTQDTAEAESEDERLTSTSPEGVSASDLASDGSTAALQLSGKERAERPAKERPAKERPAKERLTIEQRLALVRAAHHEYVDALHSGDPEAVDEARKKLRREYGAAREQVLQSAHVLHATYRQVLDTPEEHLQAMTSHINGVISRITGDETAHEHETA